MFALYVSGCAALALAFSRDEHSFAAFLKGTWHLMCNTLLGALLVGAILTLLHLTFGRGNSSGGGSSVGELGEPVRWKGDTEYAKAENGYDYLGRTGD
jgi:hypothetical protein